ncbi:hypothetical protein PcaKH16_03000 [Parageobacillus caldoxylosilyticus]|nr:hypothetical protein PcaKH16_03000 [Parageobacillus caldoxylosilyticus]
MKNKKEEAAFNCLFLLSLLVKFTYHGYFSAYAFWQTGYQLDRGRNLIIHLVPIPYR